MPSVLFLGYPDVCAQFMSAVPEGYTLYYLGEGESTLNGREVGWLSVGSMLPDDLVAVIDLYIDPIEKAEAIEALPVELPAGTVLFTNILTVTATEVAAWHGSEMPTVGISYVPHLFASSGLVEAALALQSDVSAGEGAIALLREITSKEVEVVTDRVALVSARTLALIINEAAFALMEGVADAGDIDVAMKLGTNYPEGPLVWADRIGLDIVVQILQALYQEYNEERYRPCVLLKQHMRAGREIGEKR